MTTYEFGAGIWMFQQFVDRYATDAYGPPVGTLEAIEPPRRLATSSAWTSTIRLRATA